MADLSVVVPVYNGARDLAGCLESIRVALQQVPERARIEVIVCDNWSTDGSLEIAERHGARIHRIPKAEFSHGGTRNLAMEMASGEHVAFITQDATPAHDGWLAALLHGVKCLIEA